MSQSSPDLIKIKRKLDPAFSYLILETKASPDAKNHLVDLLLRLRIPVLESRLYENKEEGLSSLVAKLDPERADDISREYVSVSLPENVSCLFYGSLVHNA